MHRDDRNSPVFERLHLSTKIVRRAHQLGWPIFETMVKKRDELGGAIGIGRRLGVACATSVRLADAVGLGID
jgi:hypothetical protein